MGKRDGAWILVKSCVSLCNKTCLGVTQKLWLRAKRMGTESCCCLCNSPVLRGVCSLFHPGVGVCLDSTGSGREKRVSHVSKSCEGLAKYNRLSRHCIVHTCHTFTSYNLSLTDRFFSIYCSNIRLTHFFLPVSGVKYVGKLLFVT